MAKEDYKENETTNEEMIKEGIATPHDTDQGFYTDLDRKDLLDGDEEESSD